jgi:hypothetical protein
MQFKPVTLARRTAASPQTVTWVDAIRNVGFTSIRDVASTSQMRKHRSFADDGANGVKTGGSGPARSLSLREECRGVGPEAIGACSPLPNFLDSPLDLTYTRLVREEARPQHPCAFRAAEDGWMVVGTRTLPDLQNACAEAKVLRERLKVAARHLDGWLLLVFELVFLAELLALTCARILSKDSGAYTFSYEAQNSTRCPPLKSLVGGLHEISR